MDKFHPITGKIPDVLLVTQAPWHEGKHLLCPGTNPLAVPLWAQCEALAAVFVCPQILVSPFTCEN